MNYTRELFICDCESLKHTFSMSSFPPFNDDDDKKVHVNTLIDDWCVKIIPYYPFSMRDVFDKEDRVYTPFSITYWKNYYRESVWQKLTIAVKYIFNNSDIDAGIFGAPIIRNTRDLMRMDSVLSLITDSVSSCDMEDILSNDYRYQFKVEKIEKYMEWSLVIEPQFQNLPFSKRLWKGIKYVFGLTDSRYGEEDFFEIHPEQASKIRGIIKIIQDHNRSLDELWRK
jgi:hypothetical protein